MFDSPRIVVARLAPLLLLAGTILVCWLLVDVAIFRSGLYYRYVAAPDSTAGTTERALAVIRARYRPGARNVLVIGDSRTDEGFSAKLANSSGSDINFIGAGIAGSTPRIWYHLLREVDPDGDRFAAIVLVGIYDATLPSSEDFSNRTLDLNYLQPLLRITDARTLPASFSNPHARELAWRSVLLPAQATQADLRDLAAAPITRAHQVHDNLIAYPDSYYNYPGNSGDLSGVKLDPATLQSVSQAGLPPNLSDYLNQLRVSRTAVAKSLSPENQHYFQYWIGRIASLYRANARPVYLFTLPRGPFHQAFGPKPQASLTSVGLTAGIGVELLAPPDIAALERPEFYFDGLHLNAVGRARFTPILAHAVAAAIAAGNRNGDAR